MSWKIYKLQKWERLYSINIIIINIKGLIIIEMRWYLLYLLIRYVILSINEKEGYKMWNFMWEWIEKGDD
jgi:hypothetical protein